MVASPPPTTDEPLANATVSFGLALAVSSIASALLVIAKERGPAGVMAAMKSATGHHWATHSLVAVGLFIALGFGLMRTNGGRGPEVEPGGLVIAVGGGIALGCGVIGGFYLLMG
jgi:hypothetical protein